MPRSSNRKDGFPLLFLILAAALISCGARKNFPGIDPESDDVSLRYGAEWAVVTEPFAVYRIRPDINADPGGYGRRGDVEQITGRAVKYAGPAKTLWYRFEKGWLPGTSVIVHSNKLRAQNASDSLNSF